jgi:hypothetical protein
MGAGFHGGFGGTKGAYSTAIKNLPKNPSNLLKQGWKETTPSNMAKNTSSKMYTNKDGLRVRFDKGDHSQGGYGSKDHYHVLNPNSTGKHDYYLDKDGNPVPKNSKASHIIP